MKDVYGALSHTIKKISIDQGLSWSKKDQKKNIYIYREREQERVFSWTENNKYK